MRMLYHVGYVFVLFMTTQDTIGNEDESSKGVSVWNISRRPRMAVVYPTAEVSKRCQDEPQGQKSACLPVGDCPKFDRTRKPCGWTNEVPMVCCPTTERLTNTMQTVCGIRGHTSSSRLMRSIREDANFTFPSGLLSANLPSIYLPVSGRGRNSPSVVGGKPSAPLSWPWMVALDKHTFGTNYRFLCGASLIDHRHVLTAAHCFTTKDIKSPSKFTIRLESHAIGSGTRYEVQKITVHPKYQGNQNYHDIAILTLSSEVPISPTKSPICLPSANDSSGKYDGRNVTVLGWGDTSFGGPRSRVLQEAVLPTVPIASCNRTYTRVATRALPNGITRDMLCAGLESGERDSCQGDSGGPLQIYEDGVWKQIGIVSFGYGCAQPGFPGVYTRVAAYWPWIQSAMGELPTSGKSS